jgi:hypothetical protein
MLELLLRKYGNRAFPIDPEILMFKSLSRRGAKRMILKNTQSWITHPLNKPEPYIRILPRLIEAIENGLYPPEQTGMENIDLEAWTRFFQNVELTQK